MAEMQNARKALNGDEPALPSQVNRIDQQQWQGTGLMNDDSTGNCLEDNLLKGKENR